MKNMAGVFTQCLKLYIIAQGSAFYIENGFIVCNLSNKLIAFEWTLVNFAKIFN